MKVSKFRRLALGAAGALLGTRFQATAEGLADPSANKAIIEGSGEAIDLISDLPSAANLVGGRHRRSGQRGPDPGYRPLRMQPLALRSSGPGYAPVAQQQ